MIMNAPASTDHSLIAEGRTVEFALVSDHGIHVVDEIPGGERATSSPEQPTSTVESPTSHHEDRQAVHG